MRRGKRRHIRGGEQEHVPRITSFFFFNATATPEIYTLSLHDALPISSTVATIEPFRMRQQHVAARGREVFGPHAFEHQVDVPALRAAAGEPARERSGAQPRGLQDLAQRTASDAADRDLEISDRQGLVQQMQVSAEPETVVARDQVHADHVRAATPRNAASSRSGKAARSASYHARAAAPTASQRASSMASTCSIARSIAASSKWKVVARCWVPVCDHGTSTPRSDVIISFIGGASSVITTAPTLIASTM